MNELEKLSVAGSGEAGTSQRELFDARVRATVRYADPAAWTTATAVMNALAGAGELLAQGRHEIGMIAISDQGPGGTGDRKRSPPLPDRGAPGAEQPREG